MRLVIEIIFSCAIVALSLISLVQANCSDTNCSGNGVCKNETCVCYDGWQGPQCQFCGGKVRLGTSTGTIKGYWGNPVNGGKCQPCECNNQATHCHPETGKCYCTTKGHTGNHCEKCDTMNHYYSDPINKDSCYYDLITDYQFTFNLAKKEDRHYTQINFRNSPNKADIDADFFINCSVSAKMNITLRRGNSKEEWVILEDFNCTTFRHKFAKSDYNFGVEDNVTLTTFYVYVYDFQPPLWIQISFSQASQIELATILIVIIIAFEVIIY